jgi:hypothetical protein
MCRVIVFSNCESNAAVEFLDEARFELEHFPEEWSHTGEADVKEGFVLAFTWNELINNGEVEQREASRDITRVVHVGVPVVQDASHVLVRVNGTPFAFVHVRGVSLEVLCDFKEVIRFIVG